MAKKKIITTAPHVNPGFRGYTMDELRYQRALLALKREYCKDNIFELANKINKSMPFSSEGKKGLSKNIGGIASKVIGGLNYIDYILIGFSAFGTIRKVLRLFSKKRK